MIIFQLEGGDSGETSTVDEAVSAEDMLASGEPSTTGVLDEAEAMVTAPSTEATGNIPTCDF
jgi:hypothetical protein